MIPYELIHTDNETIETNTQATVPGKIKDNNTKKILLADRTEIVKPHILQSPTR